MYISDDGTNIILKEYNGKVLNLVVGVSGQPVDEKAVIAQAENSYIYQRMCSYPSIEEMIVALWERDIEGRPQAADVLETKRQAIKTKYPKNA